MERLDKMLEKYTQNQLDSFEKLGMKSIKKANVYAIKQKTGIVSTFTDAMTHGYRMKIAKDEAKAKKIQSLIKQKTGIRVEIRERKGFGTSKGEWDMIVPFYKE